MFYFFDTKINFINKNKKSWEYQEILLDSNKIYFFLILNYK